MDEAKSELHAQQGKGPGIGQKPGPPASLGPRGAGEFPRQDALSQSRSVGRVPGSPALTLSAARWLRNTGPGHRLEPILLVDSGGRAPVMLSRGCSPFAVMPSLVGRPASPQNAPL